jgi:hypothetical protein
VHELYARGKLGGWESKVNLPYRRLGPGVAKGVNSSVEPPELEYTKKPEIANSTP